ncbi:Aste57867_17110 [Aphanomyces stellatus]|uniref:Aste57867_17110 protein n=1 Tax=Aphanomyces stellatus TaxID=120398 RepID=A0A485L872_9STRA|nr:hypothetical protein As57867_017051 [Aphanomyces stellatus]VFT93868.1 Aste57867_17110 [Aphanomyces stellatus]
MLPLSLDYAHLRSLHVERNAITALPEAFDSFNVDRPFILYPTPPPTLLPRSGHVARNQIVWFPQRATWMAHVFGLFLGHSPKLRTSPTVRCYRCTFRLDRHARGGTAPRAGPRLAPAHVWHEPRVRHVAAPTRRRSAARSNRSMWWRQRSSLHLSSRSQNYERAIEMDRGQFFRNVRTDNGNIAAVCAALPRGGRVRRLWCDSDGVHVCVVDDGDT